MRKLLSNSAVSALLRQAHLTLTKRVHAASALLSLTLMTLALTASAIPAAYATPLSPITQFPLAGGDPPPRGITKGPDGNVWFTASSALNKEVKIGRITPTGIVSEWKVPTDYSLAWGIATGPDGNLWFTEFDGNKIGRFNPKTGAFAEWKLNTPFSRPIDVTTGPDGAMWFTESGSDRIGRITTSGTITEFALGSGYGPTGITTGPDGALYFTAKKANSIGRITTTGQKKYYPIPTANSSPNFIAKGPDDRLWFTESANKIGRMSLITMASLPPYYLPSPPLAVFGEFLVPTANSEPYAITAGPDSSMWFTELKASRIGRITTSGTITERPLPANSSPTGITSGSDGNLWFAENAGKIGIGMTPPVYTLIVWKGGSGVGNVASSPAGIACPGDCLEQYDGGKVVSLGASPAVGYKFDGWSGACTGTGACSIKMDSAKLVGASFSVAP